MGIQAEEICGCRVWLRVTPRASGGQCHPAQLSTFGAMPEQIGLSLGRKPEVNLWVGNLKRIGLEMRHWMSYLYLHYPARPCLMITSCQYITKITFRSRMPRDQVLAVMAERMPDFSKLTGLVQKYYVEGPEPDTYSGLYCWASKEAMDEYLKMPLRESIVRAYQTEQEPQIEVMPVLSTLRPQ